MFYLWKPRQRKVEKKMLNYSQIFYILPLTMIFKVEFLQPRPIRQDEKIKKNTTFYQLHYQYLFKYFIMVSILSDISKTLERTLINQISSFFEKIFPLYQFGLRKSFNTQHCLVAMKILK